LERLDPESFHECFMRWTESLGEAMVTLDGTGLHRARDADGNRARKRGIKGNQLNASWDPPISYDFWIF
jgi:hypothetical protein